MAERDLGHAVDPSMRRANVMVHSRGKQLQLGECMVNVRGGNPPCRLMGEMQQPLKRQWREGVFGEIAVGGNPLGFCAE